MHIHARVTDGEKFALQYTGTAEDDAQDWLLTELYDDLSRRDEYNAEEFAEFSRVVKAGEYEGHTWALERAGRTYTYMCAMGDWCKRGEYNCYGTELPK